MREGTTSLDRGKMHAQIALFTRDTRQNWLKSLQKRYGHLDSVVCWHINNEYSGECYCENCEKAFRVWLRKKYGTLKALNEGMEYRILGAHPL